MIRLPAQAHPWLAVLPLESAPVLGMARLCPGMEAAATADGIWLRGASFSQEIANLLKGVSGLEWREPLPGNRWRCPGELLPGGLLPPDLQEHDWCPLSSALVPEMPDAAIAPSIQNRLAVRVVPGGREQLVNLLLLPLNVLAAWAESAPEVRLSPLRFAVNTKGKALVYGSPLPPLNGDLWWVSDGVALPAGFRLEPELSPETTKDFLGIHKLGPQGLILFHLEGNVELVPAESLVSLNRGSARMSLALREKEDR